MSLRACSCLRRSTAHSQVHCRYIAGTFRYMRAELPGVYGVSPAAAPDTRRDLPASLIPVPAPGLRLAKRRGSRPGNYLVNMKGIFGSWRRCGSATRSVADQWRPTALALTGAKFVSFCPCGTPKFITTLTTPQRHVSGEATPRGELAEGRASQRVCERKGLGLGRPRQMMRSR